MTEVASFTFNPFRENTYILFDETKECAIIDPGCQTKEEKNEIVNFINDKKLKPVKLLMTHTHLDHIFGNHFLTQHYNLKIEMHENEIPILKAAAVYADMWGMHYDVSPEASVWLSEGDKIKFGNSELDILFTPGHCPGELCFISRKDKFIIAGDVLFYESIGRTDLPFGEHHTLLQSIREKLFVIEDDYKVYPGHGMPTTIGHEKRYNPFVGIGIATHP